MKILLRAIYPYAFLLLYLILPFDNYVRALPNILLIVLVAAFPFVITKKDIQKVKTIPVLILLGFILFLLGNALIQGRLETDINIIKKVLIAFGLLLLYFPVRNVDKLKKIVIFSSLATILFSVINVIIVYNTSEELLFKSYPLLIESLLIDRIYLGFLSVLSILICFDFLRPKFHPENRYYVVYIIINLLFLILIVSKVALLILLAVLITRQFYGKTKKVRILVTVIALTVMVFGYLQFNKEIVQQDFLKSSQNTETNFFKKTLTWDIRTIVWHCAGVISEETGLNLFGIGFKETKDRLADCYEEKIVDPQKKNRFVSDRYNTHNQYFDFYLSTGLIGLILFVGFLVYLIVSNRKVFFATALVVVLIAYCFMENIFHRQLGAYYAGLILILLITENSRNLNKTIKESEEA
ncbi:O-antigen ligase family protein [Ulvibacter antarcticus]|uniref:O-antigen ligase n=1 Tax=Ulvibacter antarcticus TaxID=442714 RepID=A0A3L9YZA3_9FLAO|nr:O-antigen ligase family protein [Ulvibacter antarcticus]RMA65976.1 O-antigen ligase [Ulvibacter antarcticus]